MPPNHAPRIFFSRRGADAKEAAPAPVEFAPSPGSAPAGEATGRRIGARRESLLEPLLASILLVTLAEIGDKTQLLSLALASRYRRPLPIVAGILAATLVNHALAAAAGSWASTLLGPTALRWALALSFAAMAAWMLVPDEPGRPGPGAGRMGIFAATAVAFFLAEMGDKTQLATVALAARYPLAFAAVVAGTTLGMLLANVPVVLLGERIARRLPARALRRAAAALFGLLGVLALFA